MVDAEIATRKLLALGDALRELANRPSGDPAALSDPLLRAAVERWLQIAIEACIDLASHVIADEGWTPPHSARAGFAVLAGHGLLPLDLAERLGSAASLRNLLVHAYATIEVARIAKIVREDLQDLRDFARHAATWLRGPADNHS